MNGGLLGLLVGMRHVRSVTSHGRTAPSVYFWRL